MKQIEQLNRKGFWRANGVFGTRSLVMMALFVAMSAALTPVTVWLTSQQKLLSFQSLPLAVGSMLFGPWAAVLMGVASDTINYLIKPMGPYHPGFAVSLAVTCVFYALWQYQRPVKLWRVACAQVCSVVFVHFGLNMIWMSTLYGQTAGQFYTGVKVVNNLVTFPFMVLAVFAVAKTVVEIEKRYAR